jgi:sec-independent protein translocase protein TatC
MDEDRKPDPLVKPFIEHLEDLRRVLMWAGLFLVAGMLVAIPLAPYVVALLKIPYRRAGLATALQITQVGGGMAIMLNTVLWSGLLISFPFIIAAAGSFVFPGLSVREKRAILRGGCASLGLFAFGVWMAWQWTVPVALQLMAQIEDWMGTPAAFWDMAGYVSFVLKLLLAFGATFQLPLLVYILGSIGIINSRQMRDKRRHVTVAMLVVGMLMTPPDPFSQVLMAAPLILLYEICIWLVRARELQRA